ncbi:MAG: response regulator [Fimbriimonadales bacterium]
MDDKGRSSILVVEDEPLVRFVIERHLSGVGHRVFLASDAESAKDIVDKHGHEIDLLIADSVLPTASGEDVATNLKEHFGAARVLMISGYPMGRRTTDGALPGYPFLQKPFTGSELLGKVNELLNVKGSK